MQPPVWSDMNWVLIIGLLIGSGLLAYLGDILGTRFGKKRISILGMRPKYTSSFITGVTGIFIALVILFSLSVTSESVRTALFSIKYLQRQINDLTVQLQESRNESELLSLRIVETQDKLLSKEEKLQEVSNTLSESIPKLEETKEALSRLTIEKENLEVTVENLRQEATILRKGLQEVRVGKIAVFANEMLVQQAVSPYSEREAVQELLNRMYRKTEFLIAARLGKDPEGVSLNIDANSENFVLSECTDAEERKFIRVLAASNVLVGESVKIRFQVNESQQVYSSGEILETQIVYPPYEESEAETVLHSVLRKVNSIAVSAGVLPDPVNGTVGSVDANDFFAAVSRLTSLQEISRVEIYASENIYTEGPLRIKIQILPITTE